MIKKVQNIQKLSTDIKKQTQQNKQLDKVIDDALFNYTNKWKSKIPVTIRRDREQQSGIVSRSMDNVSVTYAKQSNKQKGLYSKDAFDLLRGYLILTYTRC